MSLYGFGPLAANQIIHIASSDGIANLSLTSGTAQAVALPVNARYAAFSFNVDIWVAFGTSQVAQSPSSYSSAGSTQACEFNPTIRNFGATAGTTAISVYSDFTGKGSIQFYTG